MLIFRVMLMAENGDTIYDEDFMADFAFVCDFLAKALGDSRTAFVEVWQLDGMPKGTRNYRMNGKQLVAY